MAPKTHTYEELEIVEIPQDVPELGVKAGEPGTIDSIYENGRMLHVEAGREDGSTVGFLHIRVDEKGTLRVVAYTPFG